MDCDPERIWKIVDSNRQNIPSTKQHFLQSPLDLFDRLHNHHASDKGQPFRSAVNLLKSCDLSTSFILNLYDDLEGYSIVLCDDKGKEFIQLFLPYEENYIFNYLDHGQIPPVLLEILEHSECKKYGGGVICEVRNHRNITQPLDVHFLFLRPSSETFLSTTFKLANENSCSLDEQFHLESRFITTAQSPICLDPTTDVVCVNNRLFYNQHKFIGHSTLSYLQRRSHSYRASQLCISKSKPKRLLNNFLTQSHSRKFSESWKASRVNITSPECIEKVYEDISKFSKQINRTNPDNNIETQPICDEITNSGIKTNKNRSMASIPSSMNMSAIPILKKAQYKSPPPLNIWHSSKLEQGQLPKLHLLSSDQKDNNIAFSVSKSSSLMPQLFKIPTKKS